MKRSTSIYLGLLALFLSSWVVMVLVPYVQAGRLSPDVDPDTKDQSPTAYSGLAEQGRQVSAATGGVYAHSHLVRARATSADSDREYGPRRTVARDYVRDRAAYLGDSRMGPDLANAGLRHDKADWYYAHEYSPQSVSPGSNCAPMRFLFDKRRPAGQPSTEALDPKAIAADMPAPGEEVVPRHDAKALVAYLLSLKRSSYKLPEAPEEAAPDTAP